MSMRIAVVQTSYDGERPSVAEQVDAVASWVGDHLRGEEIDLLVLPELWPVGAFRPRTWQERAEALDGPIVAAMAGLARSLDTVVHLGALIERAADDRLYNTAVVLGRDGDLLATYRKIHRMRAGGLEAEILAPGTQIGVVDLPLRDGTTLRTGLATCYDLRFPELFRAMVDEGAEAFVVPASWPQIRARAWEVLLRARAVEDQALVVGASAVGTDGKTQMAGRSAVVDPAGTDLAVAGTGPGVLVVDVDLDELRAARASFPVLNDRRIRVQPGALAGPDL